MSRNYYSEINLHLVWHTKLSIPLLTPQVEAHVHRFLRQYLVNLPGAYVHEIGGIETHVHIAITVASTILVRAFGKNVGHVSNVPGKTGTLETCPTFFPDAISDLVGKLKGASSHETNRQLGRGGKLLEWQAGYGVVSFGTKDLEWVNAYIRNQRQHHGRGTVQERLERVVPPEDLAQAPPREAR